MGGLSEKGRRVRWWEGGKLSLRAARQYFHFALIILFSFSFASLSSSLFFHLLPAHVSLPFPARAYPDSRSSSSQSELAARQMKIYRSPCPVGGFNLICHSVVAETTKGRDSPWTLLLVKRAASMRFYIPSRRTIRGF